MKFSEKWLREWIDPPINSNLLYEQIISCGIEIEYIHDFKPEFKDIIVGEIVDCVIHSTIKNLKIIQVDIGSKKLLNIVCKAKNCRKGIKVAVAKIGSILPGKIVIYMRYIAGEKSEGMLCSFSELGMFNSNNIIELNKEVISGENVKNILLLKDKIIKVNTTPNRPDGLSILGISRNVAVLNKLPEPILKYKKNVINTQDKFILEIRDNTKCTFFAGRIIKNVNINIETPLWMKKKLFHSDLLSDNVIKDIINYVLIEIGQPIEVMNADKISDKIVIRTANNKEKIILKDEVIVNLDSDILVFSDNINILSIPGNIIFNSIDLDVNSKNIFLSVVLLSKKAILNISKKFNINNSLEYYRYGIDANLQIKALEYVTNLILNICGGVVGPIVKQSVKKNKCVKNKIRLRYNYLIKLVGQCIDVNTVSNILLSLNYKVCFNKDYWDLVPPSSRFDIHIEEDVISDILRIYGYNNINLIPLREKLFVNTKQLIKSHVLNSSRTLLVNRGYYEIITYSFIDPKIHYIFFPEIHPLFISNPISQDMSCMRFSLFPGLLKTISYNKNRKLMSMRFFEIGMCFKPDKNEMLGVKQDIFLGAVMSGDYLSENWYSIQRKADFYDLKGDLECVLDEICGLNNIEFKKKYISGLHPEQSAEIYLDNNCIGCIGALDPRLEEELNLNTSTFLFEISLKNMSYMHSYNKIHKVSKFPASRRDLSILISDSVAVSDILKTCKESFIDQKVKINLFDVYFCKEFNNKKKSVGISIIFEDLKKTLIDNEINLMVDNCIGVLKEKFQAILRK